MNLLELVFPGLKVAKEKKIAEDKASSKEASIGCYKADINCENCHILLEFELPKGQTVINYCEKIVCPNCGCPVFEYCSLPDNEED